MDKNQTELQEACRLVEIVCRQLGSDCQVIFTSDGVEIAPLEWPGSSTGKTLFDAIKGAQQ